jgi:uncharacterized coiled-coil DUF342 family protein
MSASEIERLEAELEKLQSQLEDQKEAADEWRRQAESHAAEFLRLDAENRQLVSKIGQLTGTHLRG